MMQDALNLIISSIRAANGWFMTIVNATGAAGVIVAFVSIVLAARFILAPIIGGAFFRTASDRVKNLVLVIRSNYMQYLFYLIWTALLVMIWLRLGQKKRVV